MQIICFLLSENEFLFYIGKKFYNFYTNYVENHIK